MANPKHLDIIRDGVDAWNRWREDNPNLLPDLSEADLNGHYLAGVNLTSAFLQATDFSKANLFDAKLVDADLRGANFSWAYLERANLSGAVLRHAKLVRAQFYQTNVCSADLGFANLSFAYLVNSNFNDANLTGCHVFAISVWNVSLERATQADLAITETIGLGEPRITVDNLEVAQFIHLLLNHKKLRDVFNSVAERGVLLLGRFGGGGLELLQAVATKLREMEYLPMMFDFERPYERNFTETVKTLAGLSRFVIVDLSGPSVPQELYATVPHYKIPFVPIIELGRKTYAMVSDILEYPWVVTPPVEFEDKDQLIAMIPERIVAPAEEKLKERKELMKKLFSR